MTQPTDYELKLRAEINSIRRIVAALDKLDVAAQHRVIHYLLDRYAPKDET